MSAALGPAGSTSGTAAHAVRLEGISKTFGRRNVLANVSFEVRAGTGFVILGRSGTGKSVTLRHIVGLVRPDRGRVLVDGTDVAHAGTRELSRVRQGIGFLFQNAALFDSITVGENVAFPVRRHTSMAQDEIRARVREKLAAVGLEGEEDKMPGALSGGMRKRAGLARALALDPPLLLVDEPSAGLDPITADEIDSLLLDLKERGGRTLVIVTHNIPSARRLGDELIMLHEGQVVERGSADHFDRSANPIVRAFMSSRHSG
ncbi:MAG TPA: ATP-binding cassette domain-containing protein [Vicinamibacterales bacterium]|nr:ATP-binding cassette domain-containing protein [Vicinamibacterales bacterium]